MGPILSSPLGAVPRTELWGSAGVLYGKNEHGRTTYRLLMASLVLGGEWSPKKLPKLGLGGEIVALAATLGGHAPAAVAIGIGVADMGMGEGLSPAVEATLPKVIDIVADLVTEHLAER